HKLYLSKHCLKIYSGKVELLINRLTVNIKVEKQKPKGFETFRLLLFKLHILGLNPPSLDGIRF
ncbi:MAG: hypothetical protein RR817_10100, partial [Niameybacter sp.]